MGSYYGGGVEGYSGIRGFESIPRQLTDLATQGLVTQQLRLTYARAAQNQPVCTKIVTMTGSTAAAATPTLCRMGIYEIADNGDGTLVASCANDTTLWAATATVYERSLLASFQPKPGQLYASALLVVTSVAAPTFRTNTNGVSASIAGYFPPIAAVINSQTDLPSSFTAGSIAATQTAFWVATIP